MNIQKIKDNLKEQTGKKLHFKFNGARNQTEEFAGTVLKTYHCIFLVQIDDENKLVKSFSYSDVLTESLEIFDFSSK